MSKISQKGFVWPEKRPDLIPFVPLVISIWSDGALSEQDFERLRAAAQRMSWISDESRAVLRGWLDPEISPTPSSLSEMRTRILETTLPDPIAATQSLSDLGLAVWFAQETEGAWTNLGSAAALRELEESLGVLGGESARKMMGVTNAPAQRHGIPISDPSALRKIMGSEHEALRDTVLNLLERPELSIEPGLSTSEYRKRVLEAVRILGELGLGRLAYPEAYGGSDAPAASVAIFETLAYGDLSVLVKFGVQFGLFGGSVHQLGTERHHAKYLERIGTMDLPGCYAMTETLHGSNVRDLETTATYDHLTRELVVHTPTEGAGKDYIGNAAEHGQLATVFARLVVAEEDHGVHAVLVPIRTVDGTTREGVTLSDRGLKAGLNGVDNGRIWFSNVCVPVGNLLDRFASIDDSGQYHSPIASSGRRFFTMLRTLVAGRVSIAAASVSASKRGLATALRYSAQRRQFGPHGAAEQPILDYRLIQRALAPRLATTFGLHFAMQSLQGQFGTRAPENDTELEVRAAGLKAYASDHCVDTLQVCREACGGRGYLAESHFSALKADTDIFTTFEGANLVLYQLVAKGLLSRYKEEMGDLSLWRALQYLSDRAETSLTELNPMSTRRTDEDHLLDPDFHLAALSYREERLLRSAATRMRARLRDGMDSLQAVNEVQDHLLALSKAHVERLILEQFQSACSTAGGDPATTDADSSGAVKLLQTVCALFALSRIEADRGWFLESGYLEGNKSRAIRTRVNALCTEVSECAEALVTAFGIPDSLLPQLD